MIFAVVALLLADWGELEGRPKHFKPAPPPKAFQRKEALDELQALMGQWQRERAEFARAQLQLRKARQRLEQANAEPELSANEPVKGFGKVLEVKKGGAVEEKKGKGKVITVGPVDPVEAQLQDAEAELEARRLACEKDPKPCEEAKALKAKLKAGNEAWDRAVEAEFQKQQASFEEQGRKIQAEIDAARRREAERNAKKMGGKLDAEGNFVDEDLP